jgi:hypothetical protein
MKRLLFCVIVFLVACATTSVLATWKKPGIGPLHFRKVVVVVPAKDEAMRRQAEDQLVAQLAPTPAVPSYQLVPSSASPDELKQALESSDFDGAVVMQVAAVEKEATWVPSSSYGAWGWYDSGYMQVNTYVRVETRIYALPSHDLLWAATSRTVDPSSTRGLVNEVAVTLREELTNEGLLPPRTAPP